MKKLLSSLLIVMMFCSCFSIIEAHAQDNDPEEVVLDMTTYEKIKELYQKRSFLLKDWNTNEEMINAIDYEILSLGAREISTNELLEKLGYESVPYVNVTETDGISWSSVRVNMGYNGQMLELQVIRAMPKDIYSPLYSSKIEVKDRDTFASAASKKFLSVVVSNIAGALPKVGGILSGTLTVKDAINVLMDGNTATVDNFECTYQYQLTSDEVFIFVKFQGSTDKYQEFCYIGNNVDFWCEYGLNSIKIDGIDSKPIHSSEDVTGYVQSADYSNCENAAAKNFFHYKLYGQSFQLNHCVDKVEVKTINKTKSMKVPHAEFYYIIEY